MSDPSHLAEGTSWGSSGSQIFTVTPQQIRAPPLPAAGRGLSVRHRLYLGKQVSPWDEGSDLFRAGTGIGDRREESFASCRRRQGSMEQRSLLFSQETGECSVMVTKESQGPWDLFSHSQEKKATG